MSTSFWMKPDKIASPTKPAMFVFVGNKGWRGNSATLKKSLKVTRYQGDFPQLWRTDILEEEKYLWIVTSDKFIGFHGSEWW